MAKVIGIIGLAGAGKDTVAGMLQRGLVGAGAKHVTLGKFAARMYQIAGQVFPATSLTDRTLKETNHIINGHDFEDRLQYGIDAALYMHCSEIERCHVYSHFITLLENNGLTKGDGGTFGRYYDLSPRRFLQFLGDAGKLAVPNLWTKIAYKDFDKRRGIVLVTDARFSPEVADLDKLLVVLRNGVKPVAPHNSEKLAFALTHGLASFPGQELVENHGSLEDLEVEVAAVAASLAVLFSSAF